MDGSEIFTSTWRHCCRKCVFFLKKLLLILNCFIYNFKNLYINNTRTWTGRWMCSSSTSGELTTQELVTGTTLKSGRIIMAKYIYIYIYIYIYVVAYTKKK